MSDLLETGEFVFESDMSATSNGREKGPRRNADGYELGVCRVCGLEASTPSGTYCDEHKTRQRKSPEGGSPAPAGTSKVTTPKRTGKGAPTADEWSSKVFDKLAILITAVYAGAMVRRYNLNDPNDAIADSLTMEPDEARRVAKPLGRFVAGTGLSKKYGRKAIDNSDLIDAGFALYDYFDRVNDTLRQYSAQPLASVRPIRPVVPETPEGGEHGQTEPTPQQPGIPTDGDFPGFSGSNYVL